MRVPEEWPSRRGSDLPAIQNPAYRPAGTFARRRFGRSFGIRVIPGDRGEAQDPCLNTRRKRSGMDPGSPLRGVRDDGVCGEAMGLQATVVWTSILPFVACE